ncbi:MAG: Txe/YoeB family addiction module toxin [Phoenicibacter congonensis]|uniref:Endoribonuclease YoeB n=1 Tax=Phoenicibacter congonensis TaxID=1944646 RepID=A0AA43RFX2_9ACTN|nr:Txe/YoeB family addiction module toxin [Phoenicibacter congonensis]
MWKVVFTRQALKDAKKLKAAGLDAKAKSLIEVVKKDPLANPPAYEALRGNLEGSFSRRINLQHRFVYEVVPGIFEDNGVAFDGIVKVIRMWTHYEKI